MHYSNQHPQRNEFSMPLHLATHEVLPSLPGYNVGDQMRQADEILCSKEATLCDMNNMRPNDCAFILRSDGSFTYALYQGLTEGDPTLMTFQVTERGHFKIVSTKNLFLNRVKVPALSVPAAPACALSDDSSTSTDSNISDWDVSGWDVSGWDVSDVSIPSTITPSDHQSLPATNVDLEHVQCKTEDGKTKTVPMYKAGMDVYYTRQDGTTSAKVLKVHLDDLLEPYYTIQLEGGREKQTDNSHITLQC